jgi:hypothetical protein
MTLKASLVRLAGVLVAFVLTAGLWATAAQATVHSLSGNNRVQIGNGLPIPITSQAAPNGRVLPVAGATVMQTEGPDPKAIRVSPTQLTAPGNPVNLPVFLANPNVFQVQTSVTINFPNQKGTLSAGRRTGASAVQFCAGQSVTPNGNPACASAGGGPGLNGVMRYTKTTNQFGGPMQGAAGGGANVALRVNAGAPCAYAGGANPACQVIFALATPDPTGAQGGPFGFQNGTAGNAQSPGRYYMTVTAAGKIVGITNVGLGPGAANPATSYGGPWSTGKLTVSVTANLGPADEVFPMRGKDNRVNGVGAISLVSGSVSNRGLSGPNANRGWINWTIGPQLPVTPTMSTRGLAAFVGLMALAGGYALRRRFRS